MKAKRLRLYGLRGMLVFSLMLVLLANTGIGSKEIANAQTSSYLSKTGATLEFLLLLEMEGVQPTE